MSLVSIIITTHDRPLLLKRAVESAQAAGTQLEVIVVDDASMDETSSLCKSLPAIKYVRVDRNQRVAGARNVGLLASSGEYVTFLDDDDLRLPGTLDEQVRLLEADQQAGLIYAQAIVSDQSDEPTGQVYPLVFPQGDVFWKLLEQNFLPCGSVVFRRSCLNRVGLLDESVPGVDDWDIWLRIAELYSIIALQKPVMIWRRSTPVSAQRSSQAAEIVSLAVQQFRRRWLKLPRAAGASGQMRREAWEHFSANMAAHLAWDGMRSIRYGEFNQTRKNVFAGIHFGPRTLMRLACKSNIAFLRQAMAESDSEVNSVSPAQAEPDNHTG